VDGKEGSRPKAVSPPLRPLVSRWPQLHAPMHRARPEMGHDVPGCPHLSRRSRPVKGFRRAATCEHGQAKASPSG
jgi:hypothetical protein